MTLSYEVSPLFNDYQVNGWTGLGSQRLYFVDLLIDSKLFQVLELVAADVYWLDILLQVVRVPNSKLSESHD